MVVLAPIRSLVASLLALPLPRVLPIPKPA